MNQNSENNTQNKDPLLPTTNSHPTEDVPLSFTPSASDNPKQDNVININRKFKKYQNDPILSEIKDYSHDDIQNALDYHDGMDRHKYKKYGFWLIVATLGSFFLLSILDIFLSNSSKIEEYKESTILEGFIDLIKYIIPTLIGFVFADPKGSKDKTKDKDKNKPEDNKKAK